MVSEWVDGWVSDQSMHCIALGSNENNFGDFIAPEGRKFVILLYTHRHTSLIHHHHHLWEDN